MAISARALRAGKAIIEVSLLVKPVERQLKMLQARTRAIGQKFASIGTFGVAGGGFGGLRNLFIGSAAAGAAAWPVKLAANMELAVQQMAVFTGSTQVAQDALLELLRFSSVASQGPEEMANQMRLLMTRGIGSAESLSFIKSLAVLAAGSTEEFEQLTKAFADVKSATRLNGEEMRQFKNTAFNPFVEIAKRTGETFDQLKDRMEAGGISFEEVAHALQMSVLQGGLFHGMLEKISDTLIGQFRMAWAQIKVAVLPIGEEVLVILKQWMKAVNGVLPLLGGIVKASSRWVGLAVAIAAATAVAAVAFVAMGLSVQVLAIAWGGMVALGSALAGVLGLILNPVSLVIIALGGLAAWFFTATDAGRQMVQALGGYFSELWKHARTTFNGIALALSGGNIQLAAKILWQGLKVEWLAGTESLTKVLMDWKNDYIRFWVDLGMELEHATQATFVATQGTLKKLAFDFGAFIDGIGKSEADKAGLQRVAEIGKGLVDQQVRNDIIKLIDQANTWSDLITKVFDKKTQNDVSDWAKRVQEAKDELERLNKEAAAGAGNLPGANFNLGAFLPQLAAAGLAKGAKAGKTQEGFFDTRLGRQMLGGPHSPLLEATQKIERNTKTTAELIRNTKKGLGLLPVI